MTSWTEKRIRKLLDSTHTLPASDRVAFLEEACDGNGELRDALFDMLGNLNDSDWPSEAALARAARELAGSSDTSVDQSESVIDNYRLLKPIGTGGFGEVYLAEQLEPVHRLVAVKILKAGLDSRAVLLRFDAERQALAMMNHPNVARFFDAGETVQGRPYFVMELVRGQSITTFCDDHELSIPERLELMIRVSRAVQHAHQKGIIHRDIKPSNILVSMSDEVPTPKVIDFGIAKATTGSLADETAFTQHNELVGTPAYMSPEQIGGPDVDTRTDIYSLGVVLYRLIVGVPPFDMQRARKRGGMRELQRMITEDVPVKPSAMIRTLRNQSSDIAQPQVTGPAFPERQIKGEIDWIILKSLAKERDRRYETAADFAADLERHLSNEPVIAGPPSAAYRLRKFSARHTWAISLIATVTLVVVGALLFTSRQNIQLEKAKAQLESVTQFQSRMLREVSSEQMGMNIRKDLRKRIAEAYRDDLEDAKLEQVLRHFSEPIGRINLTDAAKHLINQNVLSPALLALDTTFADQPVIAATLRETISETYAELGMYNAARPISEKVLEARRQVLGEEHVDTLRALGNLGMVVLGQGELAQADVLLSDASERTEATLGARHSSTLSAKGNLGTLRHFQARYPEAESLFREQLAISRQELGIDHPDTWQAMNYLSTTLQDQGKLPEAESTIREALEISRRVNGTDHENTLVALNGLGLVLQKFGRLDAAEPHVREALEISSRIHGEEHPNTLVISGNFGALLRAQGKLQLASPYTQKSLEGSRAVLGDQHPSTVIRIVNYARHLQDLGFLADSESLFLESFQARVRLYGKDSAKTLSSMSNVGHIMLLRGKLDAAEPYLLDSLHGRQVTLGETAPVTLSSKRRLGKLRSAQGRADEAERLFREIVAAARSTLGAEHRITWLLTSDLANLLSATDQLNEAEGLHQEALAGIRRVQPAGHWEIAEIQNSLAHHLALGGQYIKAEALLLSSWKTLDRTFGNRGPKTQLAVARLAALYTAWNRPDASVEWAARKVDYLTTQ